MTGLSDIRFKLSIIVLIVLMLSLLVALPLFAANGDGSGGGSGEPLALASSDPADGRNDVPTDVRIKLTFNKNVVNMSVKDNNQKCFSLFTDTGISVPVKVVMADDQMEPEKKREIVIAPESALKPGTHYVLKISPDLKSKSGTALEKGLSLAFATAGTTPEIESTDDSTDAQKAATEGQKPAAKGQKAVEKSDKTVSNNSANNAAVSDGSNTTDTDNRTGHTGTDVENNTWNATAANESGPDAKSEPAASQEKSTEAKSSDMPDKVEQQKNPNNAYAVVLIVVLAAGITAILILKSRKRG